MEVKGFSNHQHSANVSERYVSWLSDGNITLGSRKTSTVESEGAATREVVGHGGVKGGREDTNMIVPSFSRTVPLRQLIPEFKDRSRDLDQETPHSPSFQKSCVLSFSDF